MNNPLTDKISSPSSIYLDIKSLPRGVDNYHIDIKLSPKFCSETSALIDALIRQYSSIKPTHKNHEEAISTLRKNYLDIMTVLIHRVKTDLSKTEISLLQFSITKYILTSTKSNLDNFIATEKERSTELHSHGSGKALGAHQHLAWLAKNYNSILFSVRKIIFEQLHHVDKRRLSALRDQYLGTESAIGRSTIFNPLLIEQDITRPRFLVSNYLLWNRKKDTEDFGSINHSLEKFFKSIVPAENSPPLRTRRKTSSHGEIYDALGGLLHCKQFLGSSVDSKHVLEEEFSWLDSTENIKALFDFAETNKKATKARKQKEYKIWWQLKKETSSTKKTLKKVSKILKKKKLLLHYLASYKTQHLREASVAVQVEPEIICQFLCDKLSSKQVQERERLSSGKNLSDSELNQLKVAAKEVLEDANTNIYEFSYQFLQDLARFRMQLKHYRFAHRAFNRISLLDNPEDIRLSKQADTLYQLSMSHEVNEPEKKVAHHTILKADVRGSTTVTNNLEKMELNPASYFSKRFFDPINSLVEEFGAIKVFIEGDAIILSFLEYEQEPQQWFSVARACGLAKAILKLVNVSNKHSKQMGLPPLELGIGICFSNESPRYLYDEDKPIMISSAIALADRMSACSWRLREALDPGAFNVTVLEIADGDKDKGEKGQFHMRFNVNGILLDTLAFERLKQEVNFQRISAKVGDQVTTFLYGKYPDVNRKERSLIVREGIIGVWKNSEMIEGSESNGFYYEVITNDKINSLIQSSLS